MLHSCYKKHVFSIKIAILQRKSHMQYLKTPWNLFHKVILEMVHFILKNVTDYGTYTYMTLTSLLRKWIEITAQLDRLLRSLDGRRVKDVTGIFLIITLLTIPFFTEWMSSCWASKIPESWKQTNNTNMNFFHELLGHVRQNFF